MDYRQELRDCAQARIEASFHEAFNAFLTDVAREAPSGTLGEAVSAFVAACRREACSLEERWRGI